MPTLAGLRRRGVPPAALRDFVKRIGVAKANSVVDVGMFEFSIREHLNKTAQRRMAVLRPLKVVIENYPEGQSEELEAVNHPEDPALGTRRIRFGRELFIERDDFMENPPKKFFRLSPGTEVRLRYAYFITCREVDEERGRRGGRAALHLRSRDQGRQCARRPQGEGDACIGSRPRIRVPAEVRLYNPALHQARSEPGRLRQRAQSEFAGSDRRRARRAGAGDEQFQRSGAVRAPGLFLPGQGLRRRTSSCSTAPSACATPGRKSRAAASEHALQARRPAIGVFVTA